MKLGFVGVGNMGLPMAGKFPDDGHELTVFDLRSESMIPLLERQARPGASARAMADQLETIAISHMLRSGLGHREKSGRRVDRVCSTPK